MRCISTFGLVLHLAAAGGQDRGQGGAADHLAHGALGHVLDHCVGVADVEHVLGRVRDLPLHREAQVDDVLVAGQHQALVRSGWLTVPPMSRVWIEVTGTFSACSIGRAGGSAGPAGRCGYRRRRW
jgi:hypothetical protein